MNFDELHCKQSLWNIDSPLFKKLILGYTSSIVCKIIFWILFLTRHGMHRVKNDLGVSIYIFKSFGFLFLHCFLVAKKHCVKPLSSYSWVENNYSLIITRVARSTEPHLARFLYWSAENIKTRRALFLARCHHVVWSDIVDRPLWNTTSV